MTTRTLDERPGRRGTGRCTGRAGPSPPRGGGGGRGGPGGWPQRGSQPSAYRKPGNPSRARPTSRISVTSVSRLSRRIRHPLPVQCGDQFRGQQQRARPAQVPVDGARPVAGGARGIDHGARLAHPCHPHCRAWASTLARICGWVSSRLTTRPASRPVHCW
ncbi:hypothetical protein C3Y87_08485 [Carbonactinospora thermoautotrophica]|nr:hypothetical protein [Carbonactinospora thermoautotrophica]